MGGFQNLAAKAGIAGEFLVYLWERRLFCLIPVVAILLFFGMLLIFTQSSALAPFIYTLF